MSNLPVNIRTVQPGPEPRRILSIGPARSSFVRDHLVCFAGPTTITPTKPRSRLTARSPAANRGKPQMQSLGYK